MAMMEYKTQGYNGYAVKYSPFIDSRIAVAASANFGLVGNGRLFILGLSAQGIHAEKWSVFSSRRSCAMLTRKGSIPTIQYMTRRGPRRTKTSSSSHAGMAP